MWIVRAAKLSSPVSAYETGETVYGQVRELMSAYLRQALRHPTIPMTFA